MFYISTFLTRFAIKLRLRQNLVYVLNCECVYEHYIPEESLSNGPVVIRGITDRLSYTRGIELDAQMI